MIALYFTLDIMVTVIQNWVLSRCIVTSLCKKKRGSYANWLPYTISMIMIILSTWVIKSPALHLTIVLLGNAIAIKLSYKDSVYKVLICVFLLHAICLGIDTTLFVIMNRIMPEPFVVIGNHQFGFWPTYFIDAAALLIVAYVIWVLLKDFHYEIDFKDFIVVLACYFPAFVLSQSNTMAFLGLNAEWIRPFEWILSAILGIVFALVLLCVKNQFYLREKVLEDKMKIEQLERQYAYYQSKQRDEERIRALYHDMKNHLLLLKGQQGQKNAQIAEALLAQISDYEDYLQTGNDFLDVIIRDKAQKAKECQADFKCTVRFAGGEFIQPLDISTIFGNALDNAIEAVGKLPEEERLITVKSGRVQDSLVIVFENTSVGGHIQKSSKEDRFLHGFGIPNIRRAVEKYEGECTIHKEDGKFIMKIIIPVPSAEVP